jgi:hypothetical protein
MSKDPHSNDTQGDEIDLVELFRRIRRTLAKWFRVLGTGFMVTMIFLLRNFIPIVLSIIIGIGLSYLIKWSTKPVYFSEIVFRSNTVPNADMIPYFNKLSIFIKEKNFSGVSTALSLTPEESEGIREIKAFWVIDKNRDLIPDNVDYRNRFNVYDTINTRMQDRFVVDVKLTNPNTFKDISMGLMEYARKNSYFQQENEFRLKRTDELLERLNYDIDQLDSLQKVKYFEETRNRIPEKGGQMIFLQEQKTQLVYDDIYSLYQRKQALDQEKAIYADIITVMSDFYQPAKRHNGGFYYGKIFIPSCFTLMLIYLIIYRNRKKLKEIYKRY